MDQTAASSLAPWIVSAFAEMNRPRAPIEQAMVSAGAFVIDEKCETGPYWARSVAQAVLDAMGQAYRQAASISDQEAAEGR